MSRFMLLALTGLALAFAAWVPTVRAEPVHLVTGDNFRPYVDRSLPGGGLLSILVRKVFAEMGREARIEFLPWKRAYRDMLAHEYDGSFPYRQSETRADAILYSAPLVTGRSVAVVREAPGWTLPTLVEARPRICRAGGYSSYFDDLLRDGHARLIEPADIDECLRMIGADRADAMSIDQLVFLATRAVTFVEAPLTTLALPTEGSLHFVVARDRPGAQRLIDEFDAALGRLTSAGWVADLLKRHTLATVAVAP